MSIVETSLAAQWLKTLPSNVRDVGLISGWGANIPRVSWPKNQNIKNRSNTVTNSIKTLKLAHIKKKSLKKVSSAEIGETTFQSDP